MAGARRIILDCHVSNIKVIFTISLSVCLTACLSLSMYLSDLLTVPVNLAGLPAITIPCGFDNKGLPIGLQLIGDVLQEEKILNS